MAHKMLKGYSFLFYFLMLVFSFFVGLSYAGLVGAGKNQGLAGGAIVLGYGVVGIFVGLLVALLVAYKFEREVVFKINIALAISIVGFWAYFHVKYLEKQKAKALEKQKIEQPKTPKNEEQTKPISSEAEPMAKLYRTDFQSNESDLGLGMFTPNFSENNVLYFYGSPNLEKSLMEHSPTDSITFKKSEYGGYKIITAPPWLMPDHLKLDYGLLYFKVQSVTQELVEVVVNTLSNKTVYVDKHQGRILYWPEFFLTVHSVEFLDSNAFSVHLKPMDHASKINITHSFMKPLRISGEWMFVALVNDNFDAVGKGWVRWLKNGKFLIRYSLLS